MPDDVVVQTYKAFVDGCVDVAAEDVSAKRIRWYGHTERNNEEGLPLDEQEAARKKLLLQLDPAQQELIAGLLEECRRGAIHDFLSWMEWIMTSDGFKISWRGAEISENPLGSTLHHDFMARAMGNSW
jgi:hypothetical protein